MSVDRFIGKPVEFKIGDTTYKMKCPSAKMLPKLMYIWSKKSQTLIEEDYEKMVDVIQNAVKRTYKDWSEDEIDDFVTQNFNLLMEKLPLTLGVSEAEIENVKNRVDNENTKPKAT